MLAVRDPQAQLTGRDAFLTGQLSLQLHEQADRCVPGENAREGEVARSDVNVHPIIDPSRGRRLLNVKFGGKRHVSSREILPRSSGLHSGVTESVAITASDSNFSKNPIRRRPSLRAAKRVRVSPPLPRTRTPSRMTATMKPRQSGHCQITMRRVESPLRVILREAGCTPVSSDGNPAQSLSHVAAPRGLVRTLHFNRPHFARREHGRAGAQPSMTIGKAIRP